MWLGDAMNGFKAEHDFRIDERDPSASARWLALWEGAATWLDQAALRHYPNSQYAKDALERIS